MLSNYPATCGGKTGIQNNKLQRDFNQSYFRWIIWYFGIIL